MLKFLIVQLRKLMLRNDLTKLIPDKNQEDFKPGVSVSKAVIVSA